MLVRKDRLRLQLGIAVGLALAIGCGGGSGHDAASPTPTVTGVLVSTPTAGGSVAFIATRDGILRSRDAGRTWTLVRAEAGLTGVEFVSPDEGWACGANTILRTVDGGETWSNQFANVGSPVRSLGPIAFVDPHQGIIGGSRPPVGGAFLGPALILHTTTGGEGSWDAAPIDARGNIEVGRSGVGSLCLTPGGIGLACGSGQSRICLLSDSFGARWVDISDRVQGIATACIGSDELWVVDQGARLLHSIDGGETWADRSGGLPEHFAAALRTVFFLNPSDGWIAGQQGTDEPVILSTTDGGASWTTQSLPSGSRGTIIAIEFTTPLDGIAVGGFEDNSGNSDGAVFHTATGGASWGAASLPVGTAFAVRLATAR